MANHPADRLVLTAPPGFNLARTLGSLKSSLYKGQVQTNFTSVIKSSRTPEGPGTIQFEQAGSDIVCTMWGPGAVWLAERAESILGFHDDPDTFRPEHRTLRELQKRAAGEHWGRTDRVMEALIPAIIGQKVTARGAVRSMRALARAHGGQAPGPHQNWLLPTDDCLAELPYYEYHRFDIEKKRADTIRGVAARHVRLERLTTDPISEAYRVLQAFRGVGPWTAALVAGVALGDTDAVPVGDYHIPNTVAWNLAGEERADDARMLELLEPYVGHRGRVIRWLEASGVKAPAYGPKNSVRSIRGQ